MDHEKKISEFDVHLRKKDERFAIVETELRQKVQGKSKSHDNLLRRNVKRTSVTYLPT